MATIRKLRNKYQVIIKRGEYKHKPLVKTFAKKTLATLQANKIESQIDSGDAYDGRDIKNVLVADLLNRYKEEQVSTFARTSKESQGYIVKAMAKRFSDITLNLFDSKFQIFKIRHSMMSTLELRQGVMCTAAAYFACNSGILMTGDWPTISFYGAQLEGMFQ